ncbi:MAG: cupin domain-containing protein [Actinomycetota bacterium]
MGGLTSAIEEVHTAHDFTEEFAELPNGRCQASHWGYLIKGKLRILYVDHEEVINAGEIYYMAPGHIPISEEPCSIVEFSASEEYAQTLATAQASGGRMS